ncbi:MAG: hypothetical protein RI965_182 [Bacteroidota bacterium]|jgi:hypothetical protein
MLLHSYSQFQTTAYVVDYFGSWVESILASLHMFNFSLAKIESDGEYIFSFEKKKFFIPQYFSLPKWIDFFLIFLLLREKIRNLNAQAEYLPNQPDLQLLFYHFY